MQVLRLLSTIAFTCGLFSTSTTDAIEAHQRRLAGGNAACGTARVRKPWGSLSSKEQSLYVEALGLAIKSGVVQDLAAMHLESMGETQAHQSCAFFVWHRRMLLAFESYLRDLAPKFACLTLPYYDVHTAYVNAANKKCKNMFDCSPIFQAIGGAGKGGNEQTVYYNGQEAIGMAVIGAPFQSTCDDNRQVCGAMLRNDLKKRPVPSGAGFSSFLDIVTRSTDYATFLEGIQFGLHNEIHNAVGGVMATMASPRDIFFYSWHSAIDMYLTVYHGCHIGDLGNMSETELKTSLEAFVQATQTCGGASGVDASTGLVMNVEVEGKVVDATQHPILGKYFAHVGDEMWNYGDTKRLGDFSYSYEVPTMIQTQILNNKDVCPGVSSGVVVSTPNTTTPEIREVDDGNETKAVEPVTPSPSTEPAPAPLETATNTTVNATTMPLVMDQGKVQPPPLTSLPTPATTTLAPETTTMPPTTTESTTLNVTQTTTTAPSSDTVTPSPTVPTTTASATLPPLPNDKDAYAKFLKTTYDGLMERFNGDVVLVAEQMRVIECLAFDTVFGVVQFSPAFVQNFHLASNKPMCGKKIEAVESGDVTVAVAVVPADFKPEHVEFAQADVIETVKQEAVAKAAVEEPPAPEIDPDYVPRVEARLDHAKPKQKETEHRHCE